MKAKFMEVKNIQTFVDFVSQLKGSVFLKNGEIKVNARSVLGVHYILSENPNGIEFEVDEEEEKVKLLEFMMQGNYQDEKY